MSNTVQAGPRLPLGRPHREAVRDVTDELDRNAYAAVARWGRELVRRWQSRMQRAPSTAPLVAFPHLRMVTMGRALILTPQSPRSPYSSKIMVVTMRPVHSAGMGPLRTVQTNVTPKRADRRI